MDINSLVNNPEQVKQLIAVLQALLPKEDNPETEPPTQEIKQKPDTDINDTPIRSKKVTAGNGKRENKFLAMPEINMHREDAELDKKLAKHPPIARSREYSPVSVRCRICGRTDMVNPSLVDTMDRYKCNKCAASAG
jgi:hypothetical protein